MNVEDLMLRKIMGEHPARNRETNAYPAVEHAFNSFRNHYQWVWKAEIHRGFGYISGRYFEVMYDVSDCRGKRRIIRMQYDRNQNHAHFVEHETKTPTVYYLQSRCAADFDGCKVFDCDIDTFTKWMEV